MTEELIFYADKIILMGNSKNSCVFNFAIFLKSWKYDARKIYMFYINSLPNVMTTFFSHHCVRCVTFVVTNKTHTVVSHQCNVSRRWVYGHSGQSRWAEWKMERSKPKIGWSRAEWRTVVADNDGAEVQCRAGGHGVGRGLNWPLT